MQHFTHLILLFYPFQKHFGQDQNFGRVQNNFGAIRGRGKGVRCQTFSRIFPLFFQRVKNIFWSLTDMTKLILPRSLQKLTLSRFYRSLSG